jgi:hypothetical protein
MFGLATTPRDVHVIVCALVASQIAMFIFTLQLH